VDAKKAFSRYKSFIIKNEKNPDDISKWKVITLREAIKKAGISNDNQEKINEFYIKNADNIFRTARNRSEHFMSLPKDNNFREVITATGLQKISYKREEVVFIASKLKNNNGKVILAQPLGDIWIDIGINNLHNEGGVDFRNGKKPLKLIKRVLSMCNNKNSVVLDFMAGSGTTGHAVLDLNKEDGGNRKFILCTNNELNGLEKELKKNGMNKREIEEHGICRRVTYPRLEKVIKGYKNPKGEKVEGLGGNLQYFRTDLVKKTRNKDQVRINLTQKCTEMLCVKENIFNLEKKEADYKIFSSNKKDKFLGVYYNFLDDSFDDFLKELKKLKGKKIIYMFSMDGKTDPVLFSEIEDFVIEEIPQKIIDIYKQLVKMNIPVKADLIFSDFEKAKEIIFDNKEKDEGARILRIVIEKVIQKIAQNNGINILRENAREEKLTNLNDKLKNNNIFSKIDWEENKTYIAIGNQAAHGEYSEYDLKNIENFYKHIQKLIENYNIK
jgi:adenine-specific DNA-methyltransferase